MAGRDDTVRTLISQVVEHRFMTILGAAGIGKTTIAISVGHALLDEFAGAVRFVEFGSLLDPALVATTVATTLGLVVQTDEALPSVQSFLQDKRVLLLLDNCEHVADEAARVIEHLYHHAPRAHFLATSREALRVEGERVHRLGPLETPAAYAGMSADAIQTFPAVQVFLERAAASGWSGDLTDEDVPVVASACKRLDGVALAIEIAGGLVGELGLLGTAALLDNRFRLLRQQGRRTAPPRQQTINALIAWSYDRLPERERVVLRRLSVFVGAFSFEAARAVVVEGGETDEFLLEFMSELVGKSLLACAVEDGSIVYRMLETTHAFALDRLAESNELDSVSLRHAIFMTEHLGRSTGPGELQAFRKQVSDVANVRSALQWSFSSPSGHAAGVRLAAAAAPMLLDLGLLSECDRWCSQALAVMGAGDVGTLVELGLREACAVSAMFTKGNSDEVRYALERAVELARALGGREHELRLLAGLDMFLYRSGAFKESLDIAEQNMAAARALGKPAGMVVADWMLGTSHHFCGNQPLAQQHFEEGLSLATASAELRSVFLAEDRAPQAVHAADAPALRSGPAALFSFMYTFQPTMLARTLWLRGLADRAATVGRQAVERATTLNQPVDICISLIHCIAVFMWRGDWEDAGRLIDKLAEHTERYSLSLYGAVARAQKGELLVRTNKPEEGCSLMQSAVTTMRHRRYGILDTAFAAAIAEGLCAAGAVDDGLEAIEQALTEAKRREKTFDMPELLRLKGVILSRRSAVDDRAVDEHLSSAIELARQQGALAWELRATTSMAQARLRRGSSGEELRDLSAVYAKFTEGLMTADLRAARDLLGRHF
jgi:predicted ATPase